MLEDGQNMIKTQDMYRHWIMELRYRNRMQSKKNGITKQKQFLKSEIVRAYKIQFEDGKTSYRNM